MQAICLEIARSSVSKKTLACHWRNYAAFGWRSCAWQAKVRGAVFFSLTVARHTITMILSMSVEWIA
jgi:hypothetical protein